jgi:RimJ/RimL family protein N-acetyltransferase
VAEQTVKLTDIDEPVLALLLEVAVSDADPGEVMPPVGGVSVGWTTDRREAFRAFHRARRRGSTTGAEETFAVWYGSQVAGSARLEAKPNGEFEIGLWLAASQRGRGTGQAALRALLPLARDKGASVLVANTTSGNVTALGVLARAGFAVGDPHEGGIVFARYEMRAE